MCLAKAQSPAALPISATVLATFPGFSAFDLWCRGAPRRLDAIVRCGVHETQIERRGRLDRKAATLDASSFSATVPRIQKRLKKEWLHRRTGCSGRSPSMTRAMKANVLHLKIRAHDICRRTQLSWTVSEMSECRGHSTGTDHGLTPATRSSITPCPMLEPGLKLISNRYRTDAPDRFTVHPLR